MKKIYLLYIFLSITLLFTACSENGTNDNTSDNITDTIAYPDTLISELSYTAIGASDAVGVGASPLTKGYVYLIGDSLRNFVSLLDTNNLGVSGQVISEIVATQLPLALELAPDLITIWTGGNDFKEIVAGTMHLDTFSFYLDSLLVTLTDSLPTTDIVIANLPDMSLLPLFASQPALVKAIGAQNIALIDSVIALHAETYGVTLVDLYALSGFVDVPSNISSDGFHPNNAGYEIMAKAYLREIVELYK